MKTQKKLYTNAFANAILRKTDICLNYLDTLIIRYPHSPLALRAVTMVDAEFRTKGNDEANNRLMTIKDKIIKLNPNSKMTRYLIFSRNLTDSSYEEIWL
ncbi:MAG: hypothetical protein Q8940_21535 [Bacteroidota bacterium]|nr:hypothetical protein [Bacteroidota bacterium]